MMTAWNNPHADHSLGCQRRHSSGHDGFSRKWSWDKRFEKKAVRVPGNCHSQEDFPELDQKLKYKTLHSQKKISKVI